MCKRFPLTALFASLCFLLVAAPAIRAQSPAPSSADDAGEYGEAASPIAALRGMKEKTLIFVFDVSGSMRDNNNLRRAREATIHLLRQGALPGDHVALFTFGAGNKKVFDTRLTSRTDLPDLIDQVPTHVEEGAGTNIRAPHHEALKLVDADLPHPGVIVLLTDSFNDEPKPTDPTYGDYLKYYTPGGMLKKYPRTPENRDYERLLRKLLASGKLTQFGIGIKIDDDGRPIERLPQAAPPAVEVPDAAPMVERTPGATPKPAGSSLPYIILGAVLGVGIVGYLAARPSLAATSFRISGGPNGKKDFSLKSGQTIRLGGEGAAAAFDAYALPAAREPVALVRGVRGQLTIAPNTPKGGGNPAPGARVYHNGLILEGEAPLRFGDEVRISVADPSGVGIAKEYRLKFEDPRASY